jgi:katanin p60 ATPase-containing subunit A1
VLHLFSFSKAYGMMGWRVGYVAFPAGGGGLGAQLLKAQDTIPICAAQLSQHVALGALEAGPAWVAARVAGLAANRAALIDALSPLGALGSGVAGGEGAIYLWATLPPGCGDDGAVVEWLVRKHKVCLIPGSSCGCPGHVRVAIANLDADTCAQAAARLKAGLEELAEGGMPVVTAFLERHRGPSL